MLLVNIEVLHMIIVIKFEEYLENLPIIFHNLHGYDGQIILKELNNFDVDVAVIFKGIHKYMSTVVNRYITFIDSLQFHNSSLDTLA